MADTIVASFAALTGSFQDNGFSSSFEPIEGAFDGQLGPVGSFAGTLEVFTSSFTSPGNLDGALAGTFEEITGSFTDPESIAGSLSALTGSFTGLQGAIGTIQGGLQLVTGLFTGDSPYVGTLGASLQPITGAFAGGVAHTGTVAGTMRSLRGSFAGALGEVGVISGTMRPISGSFAGGVIGTGALAGSIPRIVGYFSGGPSVNGAVLETWTMNTRHNAVTKYPSFPANSFARYNGTYIAAGPGGLYVLDGDLETTAVWRMRTGQLDDKKADLKRLTEVLLSTRYDGPITVRVWKDEATYFDYALPNIRQDVLQQVRAKVGKGLRSRYYKIELFGTGGRFELDSLQATMPVTNRRVG